MLDLRNQTFGVEVELTGVTRCQAAKVIAEHFGTTHFDSDYLYGYKSYSAKDQQGRVWKCMCDGSIMTMKKVNGIAVPASDAYSCEVVTPILHYEDIETLQEIVRKLKAAGAMANKSTGIHVHVGADKHNVKSLVNLVKLMSAKEDLIYKALDVRHNREIQYTKKVDSVFLSKILNDRPDSMDKLENQWYNGNVLHNHYNHTRYHGLNLHATFTKGTVEFRLFNGTTHAGKIKAYVQFCLALSAMAINAKSASPKKPVTDNEKYTFRCFLLRLGLIGDEFKTCRYHLLDKLEGNAAWRHAA